MSALRPGMKIIHAHQQSWGVGEILEIDDDHPPRLLVRFAGRDEAVLVSSRDPAVRRFRFPAGAAALFKGAPVTILGDAPLGRYRARTAEGNELSLREQDLTALAPRPGPLDRLAEGRWGDVAAWKLRAEITALDHERRGDLSALFGSRVLALPHQLGVVQRVLAAREPRFVLADEVGLGKTIEAGLVLTALRQAGLVRRVLVLAPAHLTLQWLAELYHKFNLLFTLMDTARHQGASADDPTKSPWAQFSLVIASHEQIRSGDHAQEAAQAGWDLVIIDEAHHLLGEKIHASVAAIAERTWGLLLLTATPLQLGARAYFNLLQLVDPTSSSTEEAFAARLSAQGSLAGELRAMLAGDTSAGTRIKALFAEDDELQALEGDALLAHLAENYSLSARLIRNRRAVVGGFTARQLHIVEVADSSEERALETDITAALARAAAEGSLPTGAPLASLLRRFGSSPEALAAALDRRSETALSALAPRARSLGAGGRWDAFSDLLKSLGREKALVFAESRETLEALRARLSVTGVEALVYHGDLSSLDRDRAVARFRDPDGPRVLLSTELGGEGRNFQFCHVLIHYDLPWSPAAIEQRIGRIDRVGQTRPVDQYVFREKGDRLNARVVDLLSSSVRVFEETVGGLDEMLEDVEPALCTLALGGNWTKYGADLEQRVRTAREQIRVSYDPLLDRRSFDPDTVAKMARETGKRLGLSALPSDLTAALAAIGDAYAQRLERATLDVALRIGLGADTDVDVLPGQAAFTVGPELKVDALAGFELHDERVVLGTFRRAVAVQAEDIEFFTSGHPLIEALFGWVRDGSLGRATVARATRPSEGAALVARYLPRWPEAADLAMGAGVPSRRAERALGVEAISATVQLAGSTVLDDSSLAQTLRSLTLTDLPAPGRATPPGFRAVVERLAHAAQTQAQRGLAVAVKAAVTRLETDRDAASARLARHLAHLGTPLKERLELLAAEGRPYDDALEALRAARLELDTACVLQLGA